MTTKNEPIRVFVDNCIISLSDTLQVSHKQYEFIWGDTVQCVNIVGYMRKNMPGPEHRWKGDQIECLPTIGRIARDKKISLYSYNELRHEAWKRHGSGSIRHIGNIFEGVEITDVDAAVERSYFFQMGMSEYISKKQVVQYCKWLHTPNIEKLPDKLNNIKKKYPEFLLNNLRGIQRFRNLCVGLSENQYPDAFHLWTAEVNGIELFLTTDRKFIRSLAQTKNLKLPCQPLSPSDLLDKFEINERDCFKYPEKQFHNIFGEPI